MKTIANCQKAEEAHLVRMRLEDAGIPAFLRDETMAQVWGLSLDVGGIKVEVADEDAEAARELLAGEEE